MTVDLEQEARKVSHRTAHVGLFGTFNDAEIGLLLVDLITAGPQSPVQFARATLARLGLADERTLDAYERLFHDGDASAFAVLMQTGPMTRPRRGVAADDPPVILATNFCAQTDKRS
jgi:hypothetical protein